MLSQLSRGKHSDGHSNPDQIEEGNWCARTQQQKQGREVPSWRNSIHEVGRDPRATDVAVWHSTSGWVGLRGTWKTWYRSGYCPRATDTVIRHALSAVSSGNRRQEGVVRRSRTTTPIDMKEAAAGRGKGQSRPRQSQNPTEVRSAMTYECRRCTDQADLRKKNLANNYAAKVKTGRA